KLAEPTLSLADFPRSVGDTTALLVWLRNLKSTPTRRQGGEQLCQRRLLKITALLWHCRMGDTQSVRCLLKNSRYCRQYLVLSDVKSLPSIKLAVGSAEDDYLRQSPPLHLALLSGEQDLLRLLVMSKYRGAIEAVDQPLCRAPLHLAAGMADSKACSTLISLGASPSIVDANNRTPLHILALSSAAVPNKLSTTEVCATARVLITGQTPSGSNQSMSAKLFVDLPDEFGLTALHLAIIGSLSDLANCLISEFGASILTRDKRGQTPLHWAAVATDSKNKSVVENLLENFLPPSDDVKCNDLLTALSAKEHTCGATPLHLAAGANQVAAVRCLVARGAKIDAVDNRGLTPFHWAVTRRANDVVKTWLLENSWPVPFDAVLAVAACNNIPALELLIKNLHGLHESEATNCSTLLQPSMTPAHVAAAAGSVNSLAWALRARPDWLTMPDSERGWTPLHWAAACGHVTCASLLVDLGAPHTVFNAAMKDGWTPLDCALFAKQQRAVDWLRGRGAVTLEELRLRAANRIQRWWRRLRT
ncbi:hypothetical protein BOX15_Mlig031194g3, partial [Macrostomum lignano]